MSPSSGRPNGSEPGRAVRRGDPMDRYVVEAKLGEGGTATVYRVRHADLGTVHALKLLHVVAGHMQDRLVQEGRIQATLRHPNIVAVTDVVRVGGFPGLVLDYVEGPALDLLLVNYRPTPAQIDQLGREILAGMRAAHEKGLVHRDLKPGNVLVQVDGGRVTAKVSDFGLAKVLDDGVSGRGARTRTGVFMGTPTYMAPEQFRSAKDVDHRADVFALGAVLYELVSGCSAFYGEDVISVYTSTSTGGYVPLDEVAPDAPKRWVDAVHAALHWDPARRPQSVAELLERWVGGAPEPVDAWSADAVRALARLTESASTGLEPSLVDEPTPPPVGDAPPERSALARRSRLAPLLLAGVVGASLLALAGALAVVVGAVVVGSRSAPSAEDVLTAPVPIVAEPLPAPAVPVVADPLPAVAAPPSPPPPTPTPQAPPRGPSRLAPAPAPAPVALPPTPGAPASAPVSAPAAVGTRLDVVGGDRAWLQDASGQRLQPGLVPAGTYTLHVFFDAAKPTRVMDLVVAEGERRTVRCDATMRICR